MKYPRQAFTPGRPFCAGFFRRVSLKNAGVMTILTLTGCALIAHWAWRSASASTVTTISTVAGSSVNTGLVANFQNARGITSNSNGTVIFVADTANHVIRKVDTVAATVTIYAGTAGSSGLSGDGAAATAAQLSSPSDVVLDSLGNLYIADTGNNRIRKVATNGTISTLSGGALGASDGPIATATFNQPRGLGIDSANNIYVADTDNNRIRKISVSVVQTIVNSGGSPGFDGDNPAPATGAQISGPADVAVDSANNIYIADSGNNRVRVVTSGTINAFAGGGAIDGASGTPPTDIKLLNPTSVTVEGTFVYIADNGNSRVRVVNTVTNTLDTLAGNGTQGFDGDGPAGTRALTLPYGVAVASGGGTIYIMDTGNRRLRKVTGGNLTTVVSDGSSGFAGDGGAATSAQLNTPRGVAVDSQGNFYIADTFNHVIRKVNKSDGKINTIAGTGTASVNAQDPNGDGGAAASATLNNPGALAVDSGGNVYIADTGNNRIRRVDPNGTIDTVVGSRNGTDIGGVKLNNPQGLAVDLSNNVLIADTDNNRIRLLANGTVTLLAGTGAAGLSGDNSPNPATAATLRRPQGVGVAPNGDIYIADTGNNHIRKLTLSNGIYKITSVAPVGVNIQPCTSAQSNCGDGSIPTGAKFNSPTAVVVDASGDYYIADRGNNRIRKVSVNGTLNDPLDDIINTVIGTGVSGFSGDGGLASQATINFPYGIAIGTDGVYIADTLNNRIRLAVAPPNTAPTLPTPGNKTIAEGQPLTLTLQGTDPDAGQTLTYSMKDTATGLALAGATLNASTGAFSYTPAFTVAPNIVNGSKVFTVEFKVTDSGSPVAFTTQTITITVTNVNQRPTANSGNIPATIEATGPTGATLALNGTASDPDSDPLTIAWFDGAGQIASALVVNVPLALGPHSLVLTATDNQNLSFSTTAKPISVVDTTAPIFSSVPSDISQPAPQNAQGVVINYTLPMASDLVTGPCNLNGSPCLLSLSPPDKLPGATFPLGTTQVTFTANDGRGNSSTATFKVVIGTGPDNTGRAVYKINSFAGSGSFGTGGNGGPAASAAFKKPHGVVMDASGNVYIADTFARVVRKVAATDGVITTIAGTGDKGAGGDGGQATQAKLSDPTGLAVDSAGNLYIADTGNQVIRKVTVANGVISTVAGSYVAAFSGDGGPATAALLNYPTSMAVDGAGNLYIADTDNHRIRKVTAGTGIITTIAGSVIAGFSGDNGPAANATLNTPTGVAVTSDGTTIYIADQKNHRVRRISSGQITTFAGNGGIGFSGDGALATAAALNLPTSIVIDPDSNVLITDQGNDRIRCVGFSDNLITTIAGNGSAGNNGDGGLAKDATLDHPTALTVDRRNGATRSEVYFSDAANLRVRRLNVSNSPPVPTTVADQTVRRDRTLDVQLSAADADGDPVTFAVDSNTNLGFLSITNQNPSARTATLRINPNGGNLGTYSLRIKATDSKQSNTLTPQFTIIIKDNGAPVACIVGGATFSVSSGPITLVVDGRCSSDPDNDPLTYDWKEGATTLGSTSTIAPTLNAGVHVITLTVSDGSLTNSFTQTITVGANNAIQAIINGPSSVNSPNGSPVPVTFDGSQSTGNPTSYQWMVDGNASVTTATLTTSLSVGQHTIKLTVNGAGGSSTATKTVNVTTGGPTAVINVSPSDTVTSTNGTNATVTLDGLQSQGTGLTYQWTEGNTALGNTATITPTLTIGAHLIKLTVTDNQNRTSEATRTITVVQGGAAVCGDGVGLYICPVGSAIPGINPSSAKQGQTVDVTLNGNGFEPGATVVFSGGGISTNVLSVTPTTIVVRVTVSINATVGSSNTTRRIISIINPSGSTATTGHVFGIFPR